MDPCAGESVIPGNEAENVPLEDGDRKGCKYEVASGGIIRNIGQRMFAVLTRDGGPPKQLNLQVSEVHKGLWSVIELIDNGHGVVFDWDVSIIQETALCHCDTMKRTDDSFVLITWVKSVDEVRKSRFGRQVYNYLEP